MSKVNDIFLSYSRMDSERVRALAEVLQRRGFTVWWDTFVPPGRSYDEVIENELRKSRCVVVLWSKESVNSAWVKEEAAYARENERLFPVLIDNVEPPIAFRRIMSADLIGWDGKPNSPVVAKLLQDLHQALGKTNDPEPESSQNVDQPSLRSDRGQRSRKRWWEIWK